MSGQTVVHVYYGNAATHPIIMNYVRCNGGRRHRILLGKPFGNKFLRLVQLFWGLVGLRLSGAKLIVHTHDVVSAALAVSLPFKNVIFDSHEMMEAKLLKNSGQIILQMLGCKRKISFIRINFLV